MTTRLVRWKDFQKSVLSTLNGIQKESINCRRAYVSGLYVGLLMGVKHVEFGCPNLPEGFWRFISKIDVPAKILPAFLVDLGYWSGGSIILLEEDFQNIGLRHGLPGKYYAMGIFEAAVVGIALVPYFFESRGENVYQEITRRLDEQINWVSNFVV